MLHSSFAMFVVFVLCALIPFSYNIENFDIESMALSCPEYDKCSGYKFDKNNNERNCECDSSCTAYNDCCVDYRGKSEPVPDNITMQRMVCLNIGENKHIGVYAIASCPDDYNGPPEVREQCEGPDDFRNPFMAAPVTGWPPATVYKNYYCAKCNNGFGILGHIFHIKLFCEGLQGMSDEEILAEMTYNMRYKSWGVSRINNETETRFYTCSMFFDAPPKLDRRVRFCRAKLVDSCSNLWKKNSVKRRCEEYMAVVYDGSLAYRNPHCAFCNFKSVDEISCKSDLFAMKRQLPGVLLLNPNQKYWKGRKHTLINICNEYIMQGRELIGTGCGKVPMYRLFLYQTNIPMLIRQ